MTALHLTAAQLLDQYGQYGAAVRGIKAGAAVRYLVITDPATMILEGDAVQVEVADPDGTLWETASKALHLNNTHRTIDQTAPFVTVTELVQGYEREIPKPATNPMLLQFGGDK